MVKDRPDREETRTIGLKSLRDREQSSATDLLLFASSDETKKLAPRTSSVTNLSSIKVMLPTPASTIFLQNYIQNTNGHPILCKFFKSQA